MKVNQIVIDAVAHLGQYVYNGYIGISYDLVTVVLVHPQVVHPQFTQMAVLPHSICCATLLNVPLSGRKYGNLA